MFAELFYNIDPEFPEQGIVVYEFEGQFFWFFELYQDEFFGPFVTTEAATENAKEMCGPFAAI